MPDAQDNILFAKQDGSDFANLEIRSKVGIGTEYPGYEVNVDGDIRSRGNLVINHNVAIGTDSAKFNLHVKGNTEIHSGGSGAGFSFESRSVGSIVFNPTKGERWVWYSQEASQGNSTARLWSGRI